MPFRSTASRMASMCARRYSMRSSSMLPSASTMSRAPRPFSATYGFFTHLHTMMVEVDGFAVRVAVGVITGKRGTLPSHWLSAVAPPQRNPSGNARFSVEKRAKVPVPFARHLCTQRWLANQSWWSPRSVRVSSTRASWRSSAATASAPSRLVPDIKPMKMSDRLLILSYDLGCSGVLSSLATASLGVSGFTD